MDNSAQNLEKIEAAFTKMKRAMGGAREHMTEGLQLTRTQLEIIGFLVSKPAQTTGQLAASLMLTQSAVTQTIETLVRRGLVQRQPDEHDRRVILLQLSADGRLISNRLLELRTAYTQALASRLTPAEIQAFGAIAQKFVDVFEDFNAPKK